MRPSRRSISGAFQAWSVAFVGALVPEFEGFQAIHFVICLFVICSRYCLLLIGK